MTVYPQAIDEKKCSKCGEVKLVNLFHCGGKFEHIDHVISLKRGGKHCLANLRPACTFCNLSKHDKELNSWLRSRK